MSNNKNNKTKPIQDRKVQLTDFYKNMKKKILGKVGV